jgi:hypothetical protein
MLTIPVTPHERDLLTQMAQIEGYSLDDYLLALVRREIYLLGTLEARHPNLLPAGDNPE